MSLAAQSNLYLATRQVRLLQSLPVARVAAVTQRLRPFSSVPAPHGQVGNESCATVHVTDEQVVHVARLSHLDVRPGSQGFVDARAALSQVLTVLSRVQVCEHGSVWAGMEPVRVLLCDFKT
jgi:hypothetical protein